jgi:uncharacterized protein
MFIEFSVANFRSIKEKQTFSMVAAKSYKEHAQFVIESADGKVPDLLSVAAIYGANASGKTNFIRALAFMRKFVVSSQQKMQVGETIEDIKAFLFTGITRNAPSEFEIVFVNDNIRYQYGFTATVERVMDEWLIAYPVRKQNWFYRSYDPEMKKYKWSFGEKFVGGEKEKDIWKNSTRDNGLFLSAAVQLNNVQLKPVFEWFQKKLLIVKDVGELSIFSSFEQCVDDARKLKQILELVKAADPSIIRLEPKKVDIIQHPRFNKFPKEMQKQFLNDKNKVFAATIICVHQGSGGEELKLDLGEESQGTQNIFSLAGPLLDVLDAGQTVVIDEINNSLHPLLVRKLIDVFNNKNINKKNAQLVFSTHDTSLLDKDLFRRDQIWFTEKDEANSTKIYPLTDFSVRTDEAFGKGYLHGRYGAIPYFTGELLDHGD